MTIEGKHVKRRIRILVKAFPQPSRKHEETVCCAGITEDTQELLRLFPIRYRRLAKDDQFDRFDLVEMTITKAADPRPESYRVDEVSIHLIEKSRKISEEAKVRLWMPFIAPSLKALTAQNTATGCSLGIIRPDPGSLKFIIKEAAQSDTGDQAVAEMIFEQASLLEDPLKPLERPKYSFAYHYTCDGHAHKHQIHDWEVQAAFIGYKRRYQTEEKALAMMRQEYGQRIPTRNPHFIMGTMAAHPRTFIVIGLLRSVFDPQDLRKQGTLF
jgi:hypothetical protein